MNVSFSNKRKKNQEKAENIEHWCRNKIVSFNEISYVVSRTFKIERITIFIFSFCIGLVTQLNGPALGVLKHHYITKRIR